MEGIVEIHEISLVRLDDRVHPGRVVPPAGYDNPHGPRASTAVGQRLSMAAGGRGPGGRVLIPTVGWSGMLVGVVSDTHDNLDLARSAIDTFADRGVEAVVHCGDVVAPFTAAVFDRGIPFYAVRGNNDGEWALADAIGAFGTYLGEMGELTMGGAEFAVYHGTAEPIVEALLDCGRYDYVCRGHTHERVIEERGGTVHLNPGGLPIEGADDRFHVATVDTQSGAIEHHRVG
jgi:putative phosphoesterase